MKVLELVQKLQKIRPESFNKMEHEFDSLNVSSAAAILIYNLKKDKRKIYEKLLLIIFLCVSLNANINQAVLGIIGSSDFNTHRNLINTILKIKAIFIQMVVLIMQKFLKLYKTTIF